MADAEITSTEITDFLHQFKEISTAAAQLRRKDDAGSLSGILRDHLGTEPSDLAVVSEDIPAHRYADADIAIEKLTERDPNHRLIGIGGGQVRWHTSLGDLLHLERYDQRMGTGQVDYVSLPVGPKEQRSVVGYGIHLSEYGGVPVAIAQRRPVPQFGQEDALIEVICPDRDVVAKLLAELRELAAAHSAIRGQIISLDPGNSASYAFIERPTLTEQDVILPDGTLDRITAHVSGIGAQATQLRRYGQHLKRGVLLYGPPGTGKTHTVRYLLASRAGETVVLMSGPALAKIGYAVNIARAMQPAIIVLEDCDLIAGSRDFDSRPKPLLFELLDAMDGLDGDSDITFLLTTNRFADLESALAQRPGRVDLAVEIPLPDAAARAALLRHYGADANFSSAAITRAAGQTEGMTASFAKELVRRAVLLAVRADAAPGDEQLSQALDELNAETQQATRSLLGNTD